MELEPTRVYILNRKIAHLLGYNISPNSMRSALCGRGPQWPDLWLGTGTQNEIDTAARLPLCKDCKKFAIRNSYGS